ncbi:MAG: pirin family protein [Pseudarcicella sp.]|nr:pirin family protein [Pseudarcicella sp.]MBP6411529.1 pirin family protein [Pseudarcicella sp.]
MQYKIFTSESRGKADHGWLKTAYSFSFSSYYNPDRINFGALRVLNDDFIAKGMGFGEHPHQNMEIITIPLRGDLAHKDSLGNASVIKQGDIQIMSAGSGIYHSEKNNSTTQDVELFQIWIFPKLEEITPRYEQKTIDTVSMKNDLLRVVSPFSEPNAVVINQDAYLYLGNWDLAHQQKYRLQSPQNGLFMLVIEGAVSFQEKSLQRRDAIEVSDFETITFQALQADTRVLFIEVPL